MSLDIRTALEQFKEQIESDGFTLLGDITQTGHKYHTIKSIKPNGKKSTGQTSYRFDYDDTKCIWFGHFKCLGNDEISINYQGRPIHDVSPAERKQRQEHRQREQKQLEATSRKQTQARATKLRKLFKQAQAATSHPYLEAKQVHHHCQLKVIDVAEAPQYGFYAFPKATKKVLLIPRYNLDGELITLQGISDCKPTTEGRQQKLNVAKQTTKGTMLTLRGSSNVVIFAEGYATGASIYEAYNQLHTVVITFDTNGLKDVSYQWAEKYKRELRYIIAADNDYNPDKTKKNGGIEAAQAAQQAIVKKRLGTSRVAIPNEGQKIKCDFNDIAVEAGQQAIINILAPAITSSLPKHDSVTPPHYSTEQTLSVKSAIQELGLTVQRFNEHPEHMVINAAAGLGKTQTVAEQVKPDNGTVLHFAPNNKLGNQTKAKISGTGQPANQFLGREAKRTMYLEGGEPTQSYTMCKTPELVKEATSKGLPPATVVCGSCPHNKKCDYQRQAEIETDHLVCSHAILPRLEMRLLGKFDFEKQVIDESFIGAMCKETSVSMEGWLSSDHIPMGIRTTVYSALMEGRPLLKALRAITDLKEQIQECVKDSKPNMPVLTMDMTDAEKLEALKDYERQPVSNAVLHAIMREIDFKRDEVIGIHYQQHSNRIVVHRRKELKTNIPSLTLDATYSPLIMSKFIPNHEAVVIPVERKANVTQCIDHTMSLSSLLPSAKEARYHKGAKKLRQGINKIISEKRQEHARVLVVTYKKLLNAGVLDVDNKEPHDGLGELDTTYFGGLRGLNDWEGWDCIIIIGRNEQRRETVEGLARCLYYDDTQPLQTGNNIHEMRGLRMRDGSHVGVKVSVYPDPRVQDVHEQKREHESTQAIDRLRLIHRDTPADVVIISNLPLDVTVDHAVTFDAMTGQSTDQKVHSFFKGFGVLPLAKAALCNLMPETFKSQDSAKHYIKKVQQNQLVKKGATAINNIYSGNTLLKSLGKGIIQYKLPSQKRPSKALVLGTLQDAKRGLVKLFGDDVVIVGDTSHVEALDVLRWEYKADNEPCKIAIETDYSYTYAKLKRLLEEQLHTKVELIALRPPDTPDIELSDSQYWRVAHAI